MKKQIVLTVLFVALFFVAGVLIGRSTTNTKVTSETQPDTVSEETSEDSFSTYPVPVDIDAGDGGYYSAMSSIEIHRGKDGKIEWVSIPIDYILAYDIPDRYGDKVYTLSEKDVLDIIDLLNSVKDETNEADIQLILDILLDEYYQYTPT